MQPKVLKLVFAPGAGGNWLVHTINNMPTVNKTVNFHHRVWIPGAALIKPTHWFPPDHYLFLHGDLHLNFFLNSIHKYWLTENQAGNDAVWFLNKMLRNWEVIVRLSHQPHQPDFDWQNLLHDPVASHAQLIRLQQQLGQEEMSLDEFSQRRNTLFDTMVSVQEVQNNWQHSVWILAVLADARLNGLLPMDWQFDSDHPWQYYQDLAQQFDNCVNIRWHDFDTDIKAPDLKHLTLQLA